MSDAKCPDWWRPTRISIREKVYQGTPGFSVRGGPRGPHIHVKTREGAEKIKSAYKDCALSIDSVHKLVNEVFDSEKSAKP